MSSPGEKQELINVLCELPDDSINEDVIAMVQRMSRGDLSPSGEVICVLIMSPLEQRRRIAELIAAGIAPSDSELYGDDLFEGENDEPTDGSPEEVEAAWDAELERRMEELDNGTVRAIPFEEFRASMDAYLDAINAK